MHADIHHLIHRVRGFECGPDGRIHVQHLCNILQDAADGHAHALGVGMGHLRESNLAWVLTQLCLDIRDMPRCGRPLEVRTWPTGGNRLYAWRQFRIHEEGRLLCNGASAWVVIDTQRGAVARMPQKVRDITPPADAHEDLPLGEDPSRLPLPEPAEYEAKIAARHADLDLNGHVNNAVLCQWLAEPVLAGVADRGQVLAGLSVRFKAEMHAGETARSLAQSLPSDDAAPDAAAWTHLLRREADGSPLVAGCSLWRPEAAHG